MSTTITPPKAQVPIGIVTINGMRIEVAQHPEFVRFFFDLMRRSGGTEAQSNAELSASIAGATAGEMVMQPAQSGALAAETTQAAPGVASFPDVMQCGGAAGFAETTWQI